MKESGRLVPGLWVANVADMMGPTVPRTPEQEAREAIDRQLEACGWTVQDRSQADVDAAAGVAVREFPLEGGEEADYLLFAGGKAIGVVEAKPEGHTLTGVEIQSDRYTKELPGTLPAYHRPFLFPYQPAGKKERLTLLPGWGWLHSHGYRADVV